MTRADLLSKLAVLLAGRTAEEIALGEISTGAQNDLQRATEIARAMVTEFGMSDEIGLINLDGARRSRVPGDPAARNAGSTARTRREPSMPRSAASSTDAHATARRVLTEQRDKLSSVTAPAARGRGHGGRRASPDPRVPPAPLARHDAVLAGRRRRSPLRSPGRALQCARSPNEPEAFGLHPARIPRGHGRGLPGRDRGPLPVRRAARVPLPAPPARRARQSA